MSEIIVEQDKSSAVPAEVMVKLSLEKLAKQEEDSLKQSQDNEPSIPLVDRHGRSRWIHTRTCYCLPNEDECRMHSDKEPGWESCPNEQFKRTRKARKLWALNPEFGKPIPVEEESSKDEVVVEA